MALNAASERKLKGVKEPLVRVTRRAAELTGQPFQIVQGVRTQAEQNALHAQGRSRPGRIVTWTKKSKHIGGNAVDFAVLVGGKISWNERLYPAVAAAFKRAAAELDVGIEWGGDWKTKDWGHVQLSARAAKPTAPAAGIGWTMQDVQAALLRHGHDPGDVDGILGKRTRAALRAFQRAAGVPQTGGADKPTLDALAKAPPKKPAPAAGDPRWAVQFLEGLGWPAHVATALVAHLMWESGGNQKKPPTIVWAAHGDKGRDGKFHSHGAPQWNDKHGRWQAYLAEAEKRGRPWEDPESQLLHLHRELKTTEKGTAAQLRKTKTLDEAVRVGVKFWRPSRPHLDRRLAVARSLAE